MAKKEQRAWEWMIPPPLPVCICVPLCSMVSLSLHDLAAYHQGMQAFTFVHPRDTGRLGGRKTHTHTYKSCLLYVKINGLYSATAFSIVCDKQERKIFPRGASRNAPIKIETENEALWDGAGVIECSSPPVCQAACNIFKPITTTAESCSGARCLQPLHCPSQLCSFLKEQQWLPALTKPWDEKGLTCFPSSNYRVLQDQWGFRDQQDQKEKGWVWFKTDQCSVTALQTQQFLKMEKLWVFLAAESSVFVHVGPSTWSLISKHFILGVLGTLNRNLSVSSVVFL